MQDLYSQIQRQFTIPPPPSESEYWCDRLLIEPVKRQPFKLFGRFMVVGCAPELHTCYVEHADHDIGFIIPKQEIKTPAMDRAKLQIQNAELIVNSSLAIIEDESRKETYHRKNIIEKRRRKR